MATDAFPRPADVAGDLTVQISDQHLGAFTRGETVVLVEQDLGAVKYGAWAYMTPNMLDDARWLEDTINFAIDSVLRPWKHPDRKGWPARVDLFPHAAALARRVRALVDRFRRTDEGDEW